MAAPTNEILGIQRSEGIYPYATEPVGLEETKLYMKIDDDITEDDDLITSLITAARSQLEELTGLSFIPKLITVQLKNQCGGIEIPYGPIPWDIDISLITDIEGDEYDIDIYGTGGFFYIPTKTDWVQLIYVAGYGYTEDLPEDLKTAIKAKVFCMYEDRVGVKDDRYDREKYLFNDLCAKHRRVWDAIF